MQFLTMKKMNMIAFIMRGNSHAVSNFREAIKGRD